MKDEYRSRLIVVAGQLRTINHSSILQSLHYIRQSFWGSTFSLTLRRLMYFVKPCNHRRFNEWPVRVSEFCNQKIKWPVWTANNNYPNKAEFPDSRSWCGGRPTVQITYREGDMKIPSTQIPLWAKKKMKLALEQWEALEWEALEWESLKHWSHLGHVGAVSIFGSFPAGCRQEWGAGSSLFVNAPHHHSPLYPYFFFS